MTAPAGSAAGERREPLHLRVMRLPTPQVALLPTSYLQQAFNDVFALAARLPGRNAFRSPEEAAGDDLLGLGPPAAAAGTEMLPDDARAEAAEIAAGPPVDVGPVVDGSHMLILPSVQGNVFVGETFHGYINLANLGSGPVSRVRMTIELQVAASASSRILLFDSSKNAVATMRPSDTLDCSVMHKVTEVGRHALVCSVAYHMSSATSPQCGMQRIYRFNVSPPFKISHKISHINNRALVQVTLENATASSVFLSDAVVHCADGVKGVRLDSAEQSRPNREFKGLHHFKQKEIYSLVFSLAAANSGVAGSGEVSLKRLSSLGTLTLDWRTPIGGAGSIVDYKLQSSRRSARSLELTVVSSPASVQVEFQFKIQVKVVNHLDRPVEPLLVFDREKMGPLFTQGINTQTIGEIPPKQAKKFSLPLIAIQPGLHSLRGVTLFDPVGHHAEECTGLCEVLAF